MNPSHNSSWTSRYRRVNLLGAVSPPLRARPAEPASYPAGSRGVIRLKGRYPLKLNVRQGSPPHTSVSDPVGENQSDFCWRAAGVLRGNECGSAPPRGGVFVTGASGVWLPPSQ